MQRAVMTATSPCILIAVPSNFSSTGLPPLLANSRDSAMARARSAQPSASSPAASAGALATFDERDYVITG
jgi:hypothetical protein